MEERLSPEFRSASLVQSVNLFAVFEPFLQFVQHTTQKADYLLKCLNGSRIHLAHPFTCGGLCFPSFM